MDKNWEESQKQIAVVFSILFPGAGFLYQKKWLTGMIFGLIHIILFILLFYQGVIMVYEKHTGMEISTFEITLMVITVIGLFLNWFADIRKLQNYK